jgi:hypothetical protein
MRIAILDNAIYDNGDEDRTRVVVHIETEEIAEMRRDRHSVQLRLTPTIVRD